MLEFRVLGPLRVSNDGDDVHVGGPRQRRLLTALLLDRNQVVSTDRLVEAVFAGEPSPNAAETLRTYVMRLRRAIQVDGAESALETRAPGYALYVPDDHVDAGRFERLVAAGRACHDRGDPAGAVAAFGEALDLWAGDAYAEFDDEGWVLPEARRLTELRASAEEQLVDAELERGLGAELVSRLEVLVTRDPLRESYRTQQMLALYRSGRHADALAVAREYRQVLADDVGLDPSPQLEELEQRILVHDDSLRGGGPSVRVVRGYRLGERLGSGRDGTVHAARLPGVDRDLAIRVVPPEIADRPDVVRRFDATLRRVAALHHDAIVPIDDHWREAGGAYVVMRRMRGRTLRDRLDAGGMSTEAVAEMASRVGSALEAAADADLVHGRVIAESVLFDEHDRAYLSDFPLGEPDADPGDDIAAFAALVLEAVTAGRDRAVDRDAADILVEALSADPRPTIASVLADLERVVGVPADPTPIHNPYKGLRAFGEADAADFFGREPLVDELVDRLGRDGIGGRLVLVVGASGSGKSSVVRAGLLPRVRAGAIAGSDRWLVTTMVPGTDPFDELAESLVGVATTSAVGRHADDDPRPAVEIARDEAGIDAVLRSLLTDDGDLLLVLDQLEELFTLAPEDVQRAFLAGLVHALSRPDSRLRVVATLRADFYDRPLEYQAFGPLVRDATVAVPAMQPAELEAAITGPADRVGLQVEPPLVAELVASVVDEAAAMPALQFTLYELAEQCDGRLDLAGYRRLGGVGGAIAARAESLYRSVDTPRDVMRRVFEQLLVIGPEGEPTRRRTPRSELTGLVEHVALEEVIDPWARARLLSYDRHPHTREPTVEVAHEALLREWPRLRRWIEEDRTAILTSAQLRDASEEWESLGRDPGALYRGTKLETTLDQLGSRTGSLPLSAREFLAASREARDRRRAREAEELARQTRTNRRLRRQLGALAVATVVAIVGGFLALDQRGRARAEQRVAVARELAAASLAVVDDDAELGILLALEAVARTRAADGTVLPEAEAALHRAVTASRVVLSVTGLGGSVDWHPDGDLFLTEGPEGSGLVDLRDPETGRSVQVFAAHDADINDVAFSGDGELLATTADDGWLRVWDLAGDLQGEMRGRGQAWAPSFSADGTRVAAAWPDEGLVRVLALDHTASPVEIRAATTPLGGSTSFAPDGLRLAVADGDSVIVVDADTGELLLRYRPGTNPLADDVLAVRWSPDARWIASGGRGLAALLTDAETGERHLTIDGHTDVHRLDWTPDGTHLATGARDGSTRIWAIDDRGVVERANLATREGAVGGVAFSPDGERLLTGDVRVTAARIWDVGLGGGAEWINLPTSPDVQGMAEFTPDGASLVLTGEETPATVWDLATGTPVRDLGAGLSVAWEVDVSPDGALVATIGWDDPPRVNVWDLRSGDLVFDVQVPDFLVERAAWSPDGELLALAGWRSSGGPGRVIVVDRSGERLAELVEDPAHAPRNVAFGPEGERLVTQRRRLDRDDPAIDGLRVWAWADGDVLADLPVFASVLAVDPTSSRVAVGEVAAAGSIWDADTAERVATLTGHSGDINALAFAPAGGTVATAGADGTVRLWAADTGAEQVVLDGRDGPVWSVAFAPDGARLASTSVGVARVWALDLDDLIAIAESRTTRALTEDECRQYLHVQACRP